MSEYVFDSMNIWILGFLIFSELKDMHCLIFFKFLLSQTLNSKKGCAFLCVHYHSLCNDEFWWSLVWWQCFFFGLCILFKYAFMFLLVLANLVSPYELFAPHALASPLGSILSFPWILGYKSCVSILMCNVHFVCEIKCYSTKLNVMDHGGVCYFYEFSYSCKSCERYNFFFNPLSFYSYQILVVNWF